MATVDKAEQLLKKPRTAYWKLEERNLKMMNMMANQILVINRLM